MITGKMMYTSDAVEVRHACDIATQLCTERHGYGTERSAVCWPCQESATGVVNEEIGLERHPTPDTW